jgi:hypothetical protein
MTKTLEQISDEIRNYSIMEKLTEGEILTLKELLTLKNKIQKRIEEYILLNVK